MGRAQWFTSSHSSGNGECVEVADAEDGVLTRDSKQRSGPVLVSRSEGWQAFVAGVVRGDFGKG
ncbi:DUF397 domain-containing protein [Streptomyces marincola]|uniref:DUF397 domain-containing protein n=1 Tax=Streptomyces marincola TaxID=2878388 RepID=UPI001CF1104C|nr:DUF397 domain-containing protein [Streptomyces marincola]UCM91811.1 DUF397 domain-containing protein [Streptomyces marincola]